MRHNAIRDTASEFLEVVCKDVKSEPPLLPVTGEVLPSGSNVEDGARADVSCIGFWMPMSRAFFDVMVFNHMAKTNRQKDINAVYKNHDQLRKDNIMPESSRLRREHLVL